VVKAREPRNLPAPVMLADIELITGNRAAAIERYRAALQVNGSHIGALNNLAYLLIPEHPDEALTIAQKALELAPDDPNVADTLGWIYYRKGIYQTAIRHLEVAVAKGPTARSQYHLALSYLKAGDRDLGSKMLATALKQDPKLPSKESTW
jgi:tetratricopeptide (TPR) repeat protein